MSKRFPGGFIFRSNPTIVGPTGSPPEGGSAPGVWTLEQASYYTKLGVWPQRVLDRALWSWGYNNRGQLGDNTIENRSSPVQIGALTTWLKVAGGAQHTIATKTDGTLWAWGRNNDGQLGQSDIVYRSSPVQVGALTNWSNVAGGSAHTIATKTDGTLWSWGNNSNGQLGQNISYAINRSSPVQVGALTNWSNVAGGFYHTIATKTDGTLWTWGWNNYGQLGLNDRVNRSSPVQVGALTTWLNVAGGIYHTIATKTDGTLWTWGKNNVGQLGQSISHTINRSSPVQIGALTTWLNVAGGGYHTIATKTDGTLWTWGWNNYGQLGQNIAYTTYRSSPVQVGALTTWSNVAGGYAHTIATKTDGTLWTWGWNLYGQLGQNISYAINRSSPVQVGALTNWSNVAGGFYHTIARLIT